jgi:hypothetical protein
VNTYSHPIFCCIVRATGGIFCSRAINNLIWREGVFYRTAHMSIDKTR